MAMRLLTRADFDGYCCAALLKYLGIIDSIAYAHPSDIQAGKLPVDKNVVLANVPYVEGCGLWFDHHLSEAERLKFRGEFKGLSATALSAARVIYDYYEGPTRLSRFDEMMKHVDIVDSAAFDENDVLNPSGWILLGFLCDPRSGLEKVKGFSISNEQFMHDIVDYLISMQIDEILNVPEISERAEMYFEMNRFCMDFLQSTSVADGKILLTDSRGFEEMPPGNRFLVYSLFPETNISIRMIDEDDGQVTISVGHSVLNRTSNVKVGPMLLKYGGGGHARVGTCKVDHKEANKVLKQIINEIKAQD